MTTQRHKIAVIGSGISGIVCAHKLSPRYEVHLYESEPQLGGHTRTVNCQDSLGNTIAMDTGFMVFNEPNYPHFDQLNGKTRTFFCGAYMGYGFHEDGVKSALNVTKKLGL